MLDIATILVERGYNVILVASGENDTSIEYPAIKQISLDIAHALKKPVVGFTSGLRIMDPKPYKSDPIIMNQINDVRKQLNIEPGNIALGRGVKSSLVLIDTFFGFEPPQTLPPYVQDIGPILSEEYPPLSPELSYFINGHERVLYLMA
ncbi:unnamed protein product [Rhizophagus irregularis]|uniref:Uncharacterized protein n=1 Tax=Rhizophagus irregularis TaxID=588596 RepID=A0A915ZQL6_9GLOM|nr:unnamed protein product [Rhizophagus irregularis]